MVCEEAPVQQIICELIQKIILSPPHICSPLQTWSILVCLYLHSSLSPLTFWTSTFFLFCPIAPSVDKLSPEKKKKINNQSGKSFFSGLDGSVWWTSSRPRRPSGDNRWRVRDFTELIGPLCKRMLRSLISAPVPSVAVCGHPELWYLISIETGPNYVYKCVCVNHMVQTMNRRCRIYVYMTLFWVLVELLRC